MGMILTRDEWTRQPQNNLRIAEAWKDYVIGAWVGGQDVIIGKSGAELVVNNSSSRDVIEQGLVNYASTYAGSELITLPNRYRTEIENTEFTLVFGAKLNTLTNVEYPHVFSIRDSVAKISVPFRERLRRIFRWKVCCKYKWHRYDRNKRQRKAKCVCHIWCRCFICREKSICKRNS